MDTIAESEAPKVKYENERRYTDEGNYFMPNDEAEVKRLDTQHAIWLKGLDSKLFLSPIDLLGKSVLDVGTGSGIWAIDCAKRNPTSEVLGVDLSNIQPATGIPDNCKFQVADVEKDWTFTTGGEDGNGDKKTFDFIHSRLLNVGIHDWPAYFARCFEHLKPGGWCEAQEIRFPFFCQDADVTAETSPFIKWSHRHLDSAAKTGLDCGAAKNFERWFKEAGFVDVEDEEQQWPWNAWGKGEKQQMIGKLQFENLNHGLQTFSLALLTKFGGYDREDADALCNEALKDNAESGRNYYAIVNFVRGQKPTA